MRESPQTSAVVLVIMDQFENRILRGSAMLGCSEVRSQVSDRHRHVAMIQHRTLCDSIHRALWPVLVCIQNPNDVVTIFRFVPLINGECL
jgi:hypothetical protein